MTDKALISDLTWRSLEMQRAAYPNMPHYIAPEEIPHLMRASSRQEQDDIHVMSLAVIADNEKDFREFISLMRNKGDCLISNDGGLFSSWRKRDIENIVKEWKYARKNNIQKIGGRISAAKREAESKEACEKIKDRWPLPRKTWRTPVLLKEAGITYNTAIKFLGPRPIAQYNYQAKLKRKAKREGRAA